MPSDWGHPDARALRPCSWWPRPPARAAANLAKLPGEGRGQPGVAGRRDSGSRPRRRPRDRVPTSAAHTGRPDVDPSTPSGAVVLGRVAASHQGEPTSRGRRESEPAVACGSLGAEAWQPPHVRRAHPKTAGDGDTEGHRPGAPVRPALRGSVLPAVCGTAVTRGPEAVGGN